MLLLNSKKMRKFTRRVLKQLQTPLGLADIELKNRAEERSWTDHLLLLLAAGRRDRTPLRYDSDSCGLNTLGCVFPIWSPFTSYMFQKVDHRDFLKSASGCWSSLFLDAFIFTSCGGVDAHKLVE